MAPPAPADEPRLAQVAWAVRDLARACRFYAEVLGFRRAGGRLLWGPGLARVQGLGEDAAATLWWLVGGQDFVQLELFEHSLPRGRPRSSTWRPCDLGWSRVSIGVAELDAALARARAAGFAPLAPTLAGGAARRAAIRDPDGVVVELVEDGGSPGAPPRPALRSVALSVADLGRARAFWVDACGLCPVDAPELQRPEREALWGLAGARRELLVARGGEVLLEIACYRDPPGAPAPADRRLCDQGLLNAALAFRERARFDRLLGRALAHGARASVECPPGAFASTYLVEPQGASLELFCTPPEGDALLGFAVEPGFAPGRPLDP